MDNRCVQRLVNAMTEHVLVMDDAGQRQIDVSHSVVNSIAKDQA